MKSITYNLKIVGAILAMIVTGFVFAFILNNPAQVALGSTIQGSDYQATTTASSNIYGSFTASRAIKSGPGSFGTVVITGANTGNINFYDATTTDVTLRTGNRSTSSILIASLPASLAANDYTFDVQLSQGLYLELVAGNMPTTTITFR